MMRLNCMTHWSMQLYPMKMVELGQPPTTTNPWDLSSCRKLPVWPQRVLTWCQSDFPGFAFYCFGRLGSRCNPHCLFRNALHPWTVEPPTHRVLVVYFHSFTIVLGLWYNYLELNCSFFGGRGIL